MQVYRIQNTESKFLLLVYGDILGETQRGCEIVPVNFPTPCLPIRIIDLSLHIGPLKFQSVPLK